MDVICSKLCTKCHTTKPIEQFYARTESADGHYNECAACKTERVKSQKQRPNRVKWRLNVETNRKICRGLIERAGKCSKCGHADLEALSIYHRTGKELLLSFTFLRSKWEFVERKLVGHGVKVWCANCAYKQREARRYSHGNA